MNFVYPTFAIIGLASLLIPIIIHLFNFRRFKKVYFTNVKFLKEVKQERATRNRLRHLLVLLTRMLALAFLALAFAQPYLPKDEEKEEVIQGAKAVSIFVDNSFSMNASSDEVSLFEKAKRKATEIVEAYAVNPENKFQLLTNDFKGKHQRLLDKDEFLTYLEEVEVTPNVRQLSDVVARQKQALEYADTEWKNLFLVSDFQKNIVDVEEEKDTTVQLFFVPLQSPNKQNVFIDSVWFAAPVRTLNESNKLMVRIRNAGDDAVAKSRLALRINNQTKALTDFNVPPNKSIVDTLNFSINQGGWHNAELNVEDTQINFDDTYYFTFEVAEKINVLSIHQGKASPYLKALFANESNFNHQTQSINQLDYAKLPKNQLIILDQLPKISTGLSADLQRYVREGGSLLVFPNDNMDMASYNSMLKALRTNTYTGKNYNEQRVKNLNLKQEVFSGVFDRMPKNTDLPFVSTGFDMTQYSNRREQVLMRFMGGKSCLSKYNVEKGKVYLAAFSLNTANSNVPSHAVFVPMVYKIALVSVKGGRIAYTIGGNERIEIPNKTDKKESAFKLKGKGDEFIPGQKIMGSRLLLSINDQLKEAGIYQLYMEAKKPLSYFGFNFNRKESFLNYFNLSELKEKYNFPNVTFLESANLEIEVGQIERGVVLWKICLLLALAFLLLEILLLRFWRV